MTQNVEKPSSAARMCVLGHRSSQNPGLDPGVGCVTSNRPLSLSELQPVICTGGVLSNPDSTTLILGVRLRTGLWATLTSFSPPLCAPSPQHASADVEKMILGNKCDVNDKRQVSKERGEKVSMMANLGLVLPGTSGQRDLRIWGFPA